MQNIDFRLNSLKVKLNKISEKKALCNQKLEGQKDIAIVCCYFNPCHYKKRLENYKIFRRGIERTGARFLTVELAFGDDNFELSEFQDMLQLRTGKENIMWQKERLLNIGIQKLIEEGYEKIAWIDTDIVFEDDNWIKDLSKILDIYPVCHGFGLVKEVDEMEELKKSHLGSVKHYYETGKIRTDKPKPGGVWAARTEILKKILLYDFAIVGSGDSYFLFGCFYHDCNDWITQVKKAPLLKNLISMNLSLEWFERFGNLVNGRVGYINHAIKLHYHGSFVNRQYVDRHSILKRHNFNPKKDIKIGKSGCWEWASDKPGLHKEVRNYFYSRKEDD